MWISLLAGGRVQVSSLSTTRVGVMFTPPPGSSLSTTRVGVLYLQNPSARLSTTRVGVIFKEVK